MTFTADGRHMLAADKFGDVLAAATEKPAGGSLIVKPVTTCCTGWWLAVLRFCEGKTFACWVLSFRSSCQCHTMSGRGEPLTSLCDARTPCPLPAQQA